MTLGTILVVDDDPVITDLVGSLLRAEGYTVHTATSGSEGLEKSASLEPDLMILDVRLPGLDGISLCREVRKSSQSPVLFLSQCAEDIDKVVGLEVGADDYLSKPFSPRELLARVRALLRRCRAWPSQSVPKGDKLVVGQLVIDMQAHSATLAGQELAPTTIEFAILRYLAQNVGHVISRQQLLDHAWGPSFFGNERTVDAHIRNLRAKLRESYSTELIVSVRGVGYKLVE